MDLTNTVAAKQATRQQVLSRVESHSKEIVEREKERTTKRKQHQGGYQGKGGKIPMSKRIADYKQRHWIIHVPKNPKLLAIVDAVFPRQDHYNDLNVNALRRREIASLAVLLLEPRPSHFKYDGRSHGDAASRRYVCTLIQKMKACITGSGVWPV